MSNLSEHEMTALGRAAWSRLARDGHIGMDLNMCVIACLVKRGVEFPNAPNNPHWIEYWANKWKHMSSWLNLNSEDDLLEFAAVEFEVFDAER